jgi:2-amino-4-hydroxy-6-hydroxymethyldihydropteridine diphosphokinase
MNLAYLLLGSNIGDAVGNVQKAGIAIQQHCGSILKSSSLYETAAWGNTNQQSFINQVLFIKTNLVANDLLQKILHIEQQMGRVRTEKYAARIIDIDILFFNKEIINETKLVIPHPEMIHRRFVLVPLSEIVPHKIHPIYKKTIDMLLKECTDPLDVTILL